jgi:hypothetical protein
VLRSIILDLKFPLVVYKKLMGREAPTLEDLRAVQPAVAQSLQTMLTYTGDFADFACTFQLTYEAYGAPKTVELKDGQSVVPGLGGLCVA